jgi:hypothetical protein
MRYDCYEMARPKCYETAAEKQKAYRLRKKGLPFLKEEAIVQTDKPRIKMRPKEIPKDEDSGSMLCLACGGYEEHKEKCAGKPQTKEEILRGLRQVIEQESGIAPETNEDAPIIVEPIRPAHIPLRQWNEKLRREAAAKKGNYHVDEWVQ